MALIITIEDSKFQRRRIVEALESGGYEVLEAANGKTGLEALATRTPDCIVLDLIMPEMDGLEFLKTLREQGLDIPVIVYSSDIQKPVREECLELGAKCFLNKPVNKEELLETIKKALDK
ncbi:histidine kinase [Candidatus Nitromaritima sp. SCGC AAA799-C22]|nr:histidine kinase [Candidatus Nitromaritima sp. SCGC AAA799-C22]